jgi:hypothetical protein
MKLLLPILLTLAAASVTITADAAENSSNKNLSLPSSLGFISKPQRHNHLFFASGRTSSASLSSRESTTSSSTNRKRGSRQQKLSLNQDNNIDKQAEKVLQTIHTFGANLILQVFGGAGAIWGFSEVIGLRTPSTAWFWRPTAQFFGAVFFARWVLELNAHLEKEDLKLFGRSNSRSTLDVMMSESNSSDGECDAAAAATEESNLLMMERFK